MNFLLNELFEGLMLALVYNPYNIYSPKLTRCVIFALFILITVLVSVFLFSLEGEKEDRDLVIAKALGPTDR